MSHNNSARGFTVIEVVLVLALAGLIFLIVFLVLPQAQRITRDNQRQAALRQTLANMATYHGIKGRYPYTTTEQADFNSTYPLDIPEPSSGLPYTVNLSAVLYSTHNVTPGDTEIAYAQGHWCSQSGPDLIDGDHADATVIALVLKLEVGGVFCMDNR